MTDRRGHHGTTARLSEKYRARTPAKIDKSFRRINGIMLLLLSHSLSLLHILRFISLVSQISVTLEAVFAHDGEINIPFECFSFSNH